MSATEILEIVLALGGGCSPSSSRRLLERFHQIMSEHGCVPEIEMTVWPDVIYTCFCSNLVEIGTTIANESVRKNLHADRMRKALELVEQGELLKATYVARGHALYNEVFSHVSPHAVPPLVIEEMQSLPATATVLDIGCGTGLIGMTC